MLSFLLLLIATSVGDDFHINNPKISVIVPVFNRESYISTCLYSILNQTMNDLEVICVDDGSTDMSLQVMKELAMKDKRLLIIHQENCGVSCARNRGLEKARGEYVTFVDSDDWIDSDAYSFVYKKAKDYHADVVMFRIFHKKNTERRKQEVLYGWNCTKVSLSFGLDYNAVYNKLYRTSMIKDNNIFFDLDVKVGEDWLFNFDMIPFIGCMVTLEKFFYHYNRLANGLYYSHTHEDTYNFVDGIVRHVKKLDHFKEIHTDENMRRINAIIEHKNRSRKAK